MQYLTSKELSEKWGIGQCRIIRLAREGRIEGAKLFGKSWMFPEDAKKPADGRTKKAKEDGREQGFFFPLFVNSPADGFHSPRTDEELELQAAELDYYACSFERAQKSFEGLLCTAKSPHIRIMSLFYLCSLSAEVYGGKSFRQYFGNLQLEFTREFPYKKEMMTVIPWLYTVMMQFQAVSDSLSFDSFYEYSPTVLPMIEYLSFFHLLNSAPDKTGHIHLEVYEILCRDFLKHGHCYEACELYFLLFLANYYLTREETALYYLKKGLTLAMEHRLYLVAACYDCYYQGAFDTAMKDFPEDFAKKIRQSSKTIGDSLGKFSKEHYNTKIYSTLSQNELRYLVFATQGKTNKELAHIMHISERTVANHYSSICEKLGINSKRELAELLTSYSGQSTKSDN